MVAMAMPEGTTAPAPAPPNAKRSPTFDSLRGMGVLLVMLYHLRLGAPNAWACIGLFFAGSGFVITIMAIEVVAKKGTFSAPLFWKRRVLRLFPALQALIITITLKCALDRIGWTGEPPRDQELHYLRSDLLWGLAFFENFNASRKLLHRCQRRSPAPPFTEPRIMLAYDMHTICSPLNPLKQPNP